MTFSFYVNAVIVARAVSRIWRFAETRLGQPAAPNESQGVGAGVRLSRARPQAVPTFSFQMSLLTQREYRMDEVPESTSSISDAETIDRRRKELRARIREHYHWYERAKSLSRNLFYIFQVLSLVCGFAAAALASIDFDEPRPPWAKPALILLPLLASTLASIIHQFSWRELYELREQGRIELKEMLLESKHSRPETIATMTALEKTMHERMVAVSRQQAASYFSFVKSAEADSSKGKMPPG